MRVKTGVKIQDIRDNYHIRSEKCGKLDSFKGINHTSRVKLRATFSLIVSHGILGSIKWGSGWEYKYVACVNKKCLNDKRYSFLKI